jgi:hypothetical protein
MIFANGRSSANNGEAEKQKSRDFQKEQMQNAGDGTEGRQGGRPAGAQQSRASTATADKTA